MSYGQMHMALYNVAPDLQVSSAQLPGKLDGGCNQLPQPRPRHSPTNCYH